MTSSNKPTLSEILRNIERGYVVDEVMTNSEIRGRAKQQLTQLIASIIGDDVKPDDEFGTDASKIYDNGFNNRAKMIRARAKEAGFNLDLKHKE